MKPRNLVKPSHISVFDDRPEGMAIPPRRDEEPAVTTTLPWYGRTFASLTIYGELSVARTPEEFALLRRRLQQEWKFNGGFVSQLSIKFLNSRLIHYFVYKAHRPNCVSFLGLLQIERSKTTFSINTAMFGMPSGSVFRLDYNACTAVAISSAACGIGIACDVWFLLRYIWVDLKTFIVRSTLPT